MENAKFDWIVVGGGISGISLAEILTRQNKSVLLIEKNDLLASETSKEFHEWVHSGALYTLVPDNLLTLRYLLGATDDLMQFYSSFPKMNLAPSESGVKVDGLGWFNGKKIVFKYRIRKLNPIWMSLVSRSVSIIKLMSNHDWLRRKAGSDYGRSKIKISYWFKYIWQQIRSKEKFFSVKSPDITMNSRVLIQDLLKASINNGLQVVTGERVISIIDNDNLAIVESDKKKYFSNNVVICSPDVISKKFNIPIKTGYAPMAIVENVPTDEEGFVELDYYLKTCINLLKKGDGIGQAGGITVNKENEIGPYLKYLISEHKKRNPSIKVIDSYVGIKKELVSKGEDRNYLYHINNNSERIWSVVLGKFTLAFSMAPEFYRRVYHENPSRVNAKISEGSDSNYVSDTSWLEIVNKNKNEIIKEESNNGND